MCRFSKQVTSFRRSIVVVINEIIISVVSNKATNYDFILPTAKLVSVT